MFAIAYRLIANHEIAAQLESKEIDSYAQEAFGLDRGLGWSTDTNRTVTSDKTRHERIGVEINRSHAMKIEGSRLNQPGLIIEFASGRFLIVDGNHRAAKRYMDGIDTMDFYSITRDDLDKIRSR